MGKGSRQRPLQVPTEKFKDNWDAIFGKKDKPQQDAKNEEAKKPQ